MLYHYTDLNAFINIIRNKKLWATNFAYLNDHKEYTWILALLEKYITDIQNEENKSIASIDFAEVHKFLKTQQNLSIPFVISFSKEEDSLSQWRAYSQNGEGISLGFDIIPGMLKQIEYSRGFREMNPGNQYINIDYSQFLLFDVDYFPKAENEEDYLKIYINNAFQHFKQSKLEYGTTDFFSNIQFYALSLWVAGIGIKSKGFYEEKETRITWIEPIRMDNSEYNEKFLNSMLRHRVSNRGITPYIEFDLVNGLLLKEVILSPKYSGNPYDVKDLLLINDFSEVKIKKSEIPYQ